MSFDQISLFCIAFTIGVLALELWYQRTGRKRRKKIKRKKPPVELIGVDQIAPALNDLGLFGHIFLQAHCSDVQSCGFRHPLAIPPRACDLIAWGAGSPDLFSETNWPKCPHCGKHTLECMKQTWARVEERLNNDNRDHI